ncbi:MAG TPA: hypothetical protein VGH14_18195 [Solirubrobacterales bacterium]
MPQESWSDMTQDEKIDALRTDIERLFAAINSANGDISAIEMGIDELFVRLNESTFLPYAVRSAAQGGG